MAAATPPVAAAAPGALGTFPEDDLPLFGPPIPDEVPLITRPSPPRPPLSVRRATPEVRRAAPTPMRTPMLDLEPPATPTLDDIPEAGEPAARPLEDAALGARAAALAIDVAVLALIDAAVVYLTLEVLGLGFGDIRLLSPGPLGAFLLALNGAYLVAFTAGGQTLGKMAAGIRVVAVDARRSVNLSRAFARECLWVVLAVPAGLGLLPGVLSRDRRGLHDRLAGTRVIRAL